MAWYHSCFGRKSLAQRQHSMEVFSYLEHLLGGYFHQDFDVVGHDVASIMAVYVSEVHSYQVLGLKADIARFKHQYAGQEDAQFKALFAPDIDPVAWSGSTVSWLDEVLSVLP